MRKSIAAAICAAVLVIASAVPASAGLHTWNNSSSHYHSSTEHGQESVGGGIHKAFTRHVGWANLGIRIKYIKSGNIVTSGTVYGSDFAVIHEQSIHQHYSTW